MKSGPGIVGSCDGEDPESRAGSGGMGMIQAMNAYSTLLRWGALVIDLDGYAVWLDVRQISLTFKEFRLLVYLASRPNRVVTRRQLLGDVWGTHDMTGARTVDVHIRRLRSKLDGDGARWIVTVHSVGYKFVPQPQEGHEAGEASRIQSAPPQERGR